MLGSAGAPSADPSRRAMIMRHRSSNYSLLAHLLPPALTLALLLACVSASTLTAQQIERCADAARFLADDRSMIVVVDTQAIDDWRTRQEVRGCAVTAAGVTTIGQAQEAVRFYQRVRSAGWIRTPDPQDAPKEASLRFRKGNIDCLFNVYAGASLLTESETRVSEAVVPKVGEERYGVFAMCMSAMDAVAR